MVGLEVHQQLDTSRKLFCKCLSKESNDYDSEFVRRLRSTAGEYGEYDNAVVFESMKLGTITYQSDNQSSCQLERDEMPPQYFDENAKKIALTIAASLNSIPFPELFVMRKIVIDGSNTSGFQRTMMISRGGTLELENQNVNVIGMYLEEDASRLIDKGDEDDHTRIYNLDRLGVPLVEIVLAPILTDPKGAKDMALALGRILRSTRKVKRGLGSIRQDVNVSVMNGAVVEIKGVQQLDQLEKIVAFEEQRQMALYEISQKSQVKTMPKVTMDDVFDVEDIFDATSSMGFLAELILGKTILCVRTRNLSGMLGFEPREGFRIGKEIAQCVKLFGADGIFHSDELPSRKILQREIDALRKRMSLEFNDGFIIVAVEKQVFTYVGELIVKRLNALRNGVPAETRVATKDNETIFLRPRPGTARMYPETDIWPILVTDEDLALAQETIPKPWKKLITELESKYGLNTQLAVQMADSDKLGLFEKICAYKNIEGNFVASSLLATITSLQRKGLNYKLLNNEIDAAFQLLSKKHITKESIEIIFEQIMSGKAHTTKDTQTNSVQITDKQLYSILEELVSQNKDVIDSQGKHAIGMLMGKAMKELRGKIAGEKINEKLNAIVSSYIDSVK